MNSNSIKQWAISFLVVDVIFFVIGMLGVLFHGDLGEGIYTVSGFFYYPFFQFVTDIFGYADQISKIIFQYGLLITAHLFYGGLVGCILHKKIFHWHFTIPVAILIILLTDIIGVFLY